MIFHTRVHGLTAYLLEISLHVPTGDGQRSQALTTPRFEAELPFMVMWRTSVSGHMLTLRRQYAQGLLVSILLCHVEQKYV